MIDNNYIDVTKCRWKYLRETNTKYFDASRNTTLSEYLEYIFKGHTFVYNSRIPKDVIRGRNADAEIRAYRPDARCEELSLIVEFDGVAHYQDQNVTLSDITKDNYLTKLGYDVVRIPYWIQLSREVVLHLFANHISNMTLSDDDMLCELPFSFYDPNKDDPCLSISVGAMAEAGRRRFLSEVTCMPEDIQHQVYYDLYRCCYAAELNQTDYVVPPYIIKAWGIEQIQSEWERIESIIFDRPFTFTSYTHGFSMFSISYTYMVQNSRAIMFQYDSEQLTEETCIQIPKILSDFHIKFPNYLIEIEGVVIAPKRDDKEHGVLIIGLTIRNTGQKAAVFSRNCLELLSDLRNLDDRIISDYFDESDTMCISFMQLTTPKTQMFYV